MGEARTLQRNVARSGVLSVQQVPDSIPLVEVIRVLNGAKVSFVLVGDHGLASWRGKPRATEDVDVVVAVRHLKKAVTALTTAFPDLETMEMPAVIRLKHRRTETVAVDLMKPLQQPYREAFKHTRVVKIGSESVRIPSLEMALVMKFSAMTSLYRADEDKYQDAHDFIRMVKNNEGFDMEKLVTIANRIYPEAGKDVADLIAKVVGGEKLVL